MRTEPARRVRCRKPWSAGRCEALPDHIATLTPAVEGHVHELFIKHGDPVKKGQPIVALDETVARADLAEKTATREQTQSFPGGPQIATSERRAGAQ